MLTQINYKVVPKRRAWFWPITVFWYAKIFALDRIYVICNIAHHLMTVSFCAYLVVWKFSLYL